MKHLFGQWTISVPIGVKILSHGFKHVFDSQSQFFIFQQPVMEKQLSPGIHQIF